MRPECQVRKRLPAGGKWIRTSGSARDKASIPRFRFGPQVRFATDSSLEGGGFELSVPQQIRFRFRESSAVSHDGLTVS